LSRGEVGRLITVCYVHKKRALPHGRAQRGQHMLIGMNGRDAGFMVEEIDFWAPGFVPEKIPEVLVLLRGQGDRTVLMRPPVS
jgi:hypothetical protein